MRRLGFVFSSEDPYPVTGERALRRALLGQRPPAEIRARKVDFESLRGITGSQEEADTTDSVLNVAIKNPLALQYLIGQELNPKQANDLGKTPLMYGAVQPA